jgi:hypothetical protein
VIARLRHLFGNARPLIAVNRTHHAVHTIASTPSMIILSRRRLIASRRRIISFCNCILSPRDRLVSSSRCVGGMWHAIENATSRDQRDALRDRGVPLQFVSRRAI